MKERSSLKWEDLIEDPTQVAGQIATLEPVIAASPRLFASGIVTSRNQSAGVQIIGIDPDSVTNDPYREGLVSGEFLTPDDREGILIGRPLAEKMGLECGRPDQPDRQHLQRRCERAALHHPGDLLHGDPCVRQRHRFPAAGKSPGDDPERRTMPARSLSC